MLFFISLLNQMKNKMVDIWSIRVVKNLVIGSFAFMLTSMTGISAAQSMVSRGTITVSEETANVINNLNTISNTIQGKSNQQDKMKDDSNMMVETASLDTQEDTQERTKDADMMGTTDGQQEKVKDVDMMGTTDGQQEKVKDADMMGTTDGQQEKVKDTDMMGTTDGQQEKVKDADMMGTTDGQQEKVKDADMMGTTDGQQEKVKDADMMGTTDGQQEKVKDAEVVVTMADSKDQQDQNQQQTTTQDQQQTTNTKVKSQKATYTPATAIVEMGQVAGAATFPTVFLYLLYKRFTEDKVKALPILYTGDAGGKDQDEEQ